jgi:hypothetical protein
MSQSVGDLKISLLLDLTPFAESVKTAMNILALFSKSAKDALKFQEPKISIADIDNELTSLKQRLNAYSAEVAKSTVGTDKLSDEMEEIGRASKRAGSTFVSLSDKLQNIGLRVTGIQGVFSTLRATLGQLLTEYNASTVALAKLENGLRNIGEGADATRKLVKQANELQTVTPFADDEIANAQAMLTTFQKTSAEIEILTPRIVDLAASYMKSGESGMDLQQVAVMLGKVNEETVGQLRRVGVAFSNEQAEKLKSLKGTEQAIFLSEILDQNFKGMAATVGQTAAGQMKIFQNKTSDLRESLGKLVADGLIPIMRVITPTIQSLANGSPVVQRFTLSIIALSTAAALLNTTFGYWPYIIGGVIAAMYSLSGAFEVNEARIQDLNDETLRSQEVSKDMKSILDDLEISAANMAEAYEGIGNAIAFMDKKQVESAKSFIIAEKAKVLALIESQKQYQLNELAKMDFVPPDAGASLENTLKFAYAPNLAKFDELLGQIETKLKVIGTDDGKDVSGSTVAKVGKSAEESISYIQQLTEEIEKLKARINSQSEGENVVEGLLAKLRQLEEELERIKQINDVGFKGVLNKRALEDLESIKLPDKKIRPKFYLPDGPDKPTEDVEEAKDTTNQIFQQSLSLASQISSVLGIGAETFAGQLLSGLQQGLSLANSFASLLSAILNISGGGGLFSLLGFAGGGQVPGSGSGDTVPAMLTPGEFVVKKGVVNKIGTGFFEWLNGGGLFSSIAGKYASGGLVTQQASAQAQVYIINPKLRGNDIELALKRTNKINSRRLT